MTSTAAAVVAELTRRKLTIAVAESLTGGLVVAELISVPGASAVVNGAVVAYNTALKRSILGVDAQLLASRGAVDPEVAEQMAFGVRAACAVEGIPASIGISTTGVAGPDPQDGHPVGTVFVCVASDAGASILSLNLEGSRQAIRETVVSELLVHLQNTLTDPQIERIPLNFGNTSRFHHVTTGEFTSTKQVARVRLCGIGGM